MDLKLEIVCRQSCSFEHCNETVIKDSVKNVVENIFNEFKLPEKSELAGVGLSVPGLIDHTGNTVIYSSNLNIANFNIKQYLQQLVNAEIYLFKDVDALMLGAYAVNELKSNSSFLYFLVEAGVGLSFLSNGKTLQLNRSGMEIGHVQLESGGPLCLCGKHGCVETYVSEHAAQKRYQELKSEKSAPSLSEMVFKSNRGDAICRQVLSDQCGYRGRAIALAVNIFSPNEVMIGGPLSRIKWNAIEIVQKAVLENVLGNFSDVSVKFMDTMEESDFIGMADTIIGREFFQSAPFNL